MKKIYINDGFLNGEGKGIESYINSEVVLMWENGDIIPLVDRDDDGSKILENRNIQMLRKLQKSGVEIYGSINPLFNKLINMDGNMEFYCPFPLNSFVNRILKSCGIELIYEK